MLQFFLRHVWLVQSDFLLFFKFPKFRTMKLWDVAFSMSRMAREDAMSKYFLKMEEFQKLKLSLFAFQSRMTCEEARIVEAPRR